MTSGGDGTATPPEHRGGSTAPGATSACAQAPDPAPLDRAWREQRAQVVATLARRLGDLQLAEDAVQKAFAVAVARWPVDGVPARPGAWLTTTAWRKALDVVRRDRFPLHDPNRARPVQEHAVAERAAEHDVDALVVEDDVLGLLLACCHPALSLEARVALTLRHVAGLTAREIATAFLVPEATMDKRLVRARGKVRDAGIGFGLPDLAGLPDRLAAAHAVIYLIFTKGYLASGHGPPVRTELCEEGVHLAGQLHALAPRDEETTGLLALLLLHGARTAARQDEAGRLVAYADQDRADWDHAAVERAGALLARTGSAPPGPYQVQAAIALLHVTAPGGQPDWAAIAALYAILHRLAPSPVIEVNRAVAVGHALGPVAGLEVLAPVLAHGRLDRYPALHAAHAHLLDRAGRHLDAQAAWRRAARCTDNPAQQHELERRAAAGPG